MWTSNKQTTTEQKRQQKNKHKNPSQKVHKNYLFILYIQKMSGCSLTRGGKPQDQSSYFPNNMRKKKNLNRNTKAKSKGKTNRKTKGGKCKSKTNRKTKGGNRKRRMRRTKGGTRKMTGGSGLVDNASQGLHEAGNKLLGNPYTPSSAANQPIGNPYQDSRNPYYV